MSSFPNVLTIAGSDSGGGAGIQADLKTMTVLHCFAMSVITALTAQNGEGVTGIHATPASFVAEQYKTLLQGFKIKAAKTGMLANADIMQELAKHLATRDFPLVVDPVCVSQSGHRLVEDEALDSLRDKIMPLADLITPNIPETEALSGVSIKNVDDVMTAIKKLQALGARAVLVKGGHFESENEPSESEHITDWLALEDGQVLYLTHRRVSAPNNHGTGCTLSAAIASYLGHGLTLESAVKKAQIFLVTALEQAFRPGRGTGPVNFLAGAGLDSFFKL